MKTITTILLAFLLTGCALVRNTVELGMTETEFKKKNYSAILSELTEDYSVYRIPHDSYTNMYVYFEKGRLVRVKEEINRPDVVIQKSVEKEVE
ncbi:hypothetical protein [Pontibacter akesuensis]|uniref:Lipoprotein n=1 Tax=Pontibacter akesuensis TaxID=388950 RepID=A0A1I7KSB0_9BACT|nr:hypothetical protein [Pontibacter akesuensis]GHA80948.1 hypothetical protein GCM10007389_39350 [Pontibacter akesuensis]SFV00362.1 hypothetical protein SAMN04487941_4045 [Pontibacter akesuensis]